ncbi:MAG: hypothetical protein WCP36_08865 [Methanomicrobiales archaeon]
MQTNDSICACSGGQVSIHVGTESYYLTSAGIASLLVYGKEVPLYQDNGIIDAEASAFQHPGKKGIIITILEEAWLVPRNTFEAIARGALAETVMQPIEWRGPA